jgi:zinc/manganese transport system ATP-binding protein
MVDEAIALTGASALATRPIGRLSGGEQQRVLVAQALVRRPSLLLLDEPLDSLDPANQAAIARLLDELAHTRGIAIVIVAHDVNPILPYVDQVVYLANGRALSGRPADVVSGGALSELYGAPVEVLETSDGRLVVVGQPDTTGHHGAHAEHSIT